MTSHNSDRLLPYLAELRRQVSQAHEHETVMLQALVESRGWSEHDDREWVAAAAAEATISCELAARRLERALAIAGEFTP
jgi:predicted regulator of Ras-like GTPase activity (Roadblock/LC7/MglB family)